MLTDVRVKPLVDGIVVVEICVDATLVSSSDGVATDVPCVVVITSDDGVEREPKSEDVDKPTDVDAVYCVREALTDEYKMPVVCGGDRVLRIVLPLDVSVDCLVDIDGFALLSVLECCVIVGTKIN